MVSCRDKDPFYSISKYTLLVTNIYLCVISVKMSKSNSQLYENSFYSVDDFFVLCVRDRLGKNLKDRDI